MKNNFTKFLIPAALFVLTVSSCNKKDDDSTPTQPTAISPTETFNYSDSWGLLAGVKTVTSIKVGTISQDITLGTAVAAFSTTAGGDTYQNAGTVKANNETLNKQSNNTYVFQPSQTDIEGISFSGGADWDVSGAGDIPSFTESFNEFPSTPEILSDDDVNLSDGYTVNFSSVSGADSILVILASGNTYAEKRVGPFASSVTFTDADLEDLGASQAGMIQVTPYVWTVRYPLGGSKKVYMVNQVTVTKIVEFKQ